MPVITGSLFDDLFFSLPFGSSPTLFFRCLASNELAGKERRSSAGRLLITPPNPELARQPHFISPPAPTSPLWITEGETAVLECLASGHPPSSSILWTLNDTVLSRPDPGERMGYAVAKEAGDYACLVDPSNANLSRIFPVRLAVRPDIIRRPKSQVFPTAKTVRFECEVTGWPTPDIRWLKVCLASAFFFSFSQKEFFLPSRYTVQVC